MLCESALKVPTTPDFEQRLRRARSPAFGPDGLGYEAWRAGGGTSAAEALNGIFGHLAASGDVPHDFDEAWLAILPKGTQEDNSGS